MRLHAAAPVRLSKLLPVHRHGMIRGTIGALTSMRVPLPRDEVTLIFPPTFAMRSRMPARPNVWRAGLGFDRIPTPSSSTTSRTNSSLALHLDVHGSGTGMFGDVVQSLLHDAVNSRLQRWRQAAEIRRHRDPRFHSGFFARSLASFRTAAISPSSCNTSGDRRPIIRRMPSMVRSTTSSVSRIFSARDCVR